MASNKGRRLYLFDIDGTLLTTGGAGSQAMREAFAALWRDAAGFEGVEFSGRTDRALFKEALHASDLLDEGFELSLRRFKRAYYRRLPQTLLSNDGRVLPGARDLLDALSSDDNATLGLGTGNFRASAGVKLRHYGIDSYFCCGGFGDKSENRAHLIEEAVHSGQRRARHETVFVIGDTVHDITAAKANGVIAVGVASGTTTEAQLAKAGADIVLSTLEDAAKHLFRSSHL